MDAWCMETKCYPNRRAPKLYFLTQWGKSNQMPQQNYRLPNKWLLAAICLRDFWHIRPTIQVVNSTGRHMSHKLILAFKASNWIQSFLRNDQQINHGQMDGIKPSKHPEPSAFSWCIQWALQSSWMVLGEWWSISLSVSVTIHDDWVPAEVSK